MTGETAVPQPPSDLGNQLTSRLCSCGCGRQATKSSGYVWAYWCDPAIPDAEKLSSRRLGGRRGQMTPAEVTRLLDGADLDTREGRQQLRERFLSLRLAGRIGTGVYRDVLAAVDGAAKDQERQPKPPPAAVIVEVAKFNGQAV